MPIYEYACSKCGQEFETLVRSGAVPDCPSCHSTISKRSCPSLPRRDRPRRRRPSAAGPCGSCGHPDGPGACAVRRARHERRPGTSYHCTGAHFTAIHWLGVTIECDHVTNPDSRAARASWRPATTSARQIAAQGAS